VNEFALEIKNLSKIYRDGTTAVDDISFSVQKGAFFGFLGPNGAGKTTTIHCITGVSYPTTGSISVLGKDVVHDYKYTRSCIGLSPQEFNTDIFAPVVKVLDYMAGYYGLTYTKRHERIEKLLAQFDLVQYRNTPFQKLSGGFKRRVMLARALVHDPELLILDEPTAGVDVALRHDLWKYFTDLNKEGKTIILTSHYIEEVERLCSEIAIIHKSKIVKQGSKESLTQNGKKLEDAFLELTGYYDNDHEDRQN
jgi:ABC-2 type transport system ATP-binding protein